MMGQSTPSTIAPQVCLCFIVEITSVEAATGDTQQEQRVKQSIDSPSRTMVKVVAMVVKVPRVKGGWQGVQSFRAAFRVLSSSGDDEVSTGEVLPSAGLRAVCLSRHLCRRRCRGGAGSQGGWVGEPGDVLKPTRVAQMPERVVRVLLNPCHSLKLNPKIVEQRELKFSQRSLVSQIAHFLASIAQGIRAKAGHAFGSWYLAPVVPPSVTLPPALKPEEGVFGYGSRHHQSLSLPITRLGELFSGSGLAVSASQGTTSVPLEVFAGTSCIPNTVSARCVPADVSSKEALAVCFQPRLVADGSKLSVFARPCSVVGSRSTSVVVPSEQTQFSDASQLGSPGRFSGFESLNCGGAGGSHKSSGAFGSLSGSPEFSAGIVGVSGVCDARQLDSGCLSQEVRRHSF
ncbi:hypothetical protein E2C01_020371 [Portunus trituberculatus]|uniref:Uncharacterized protein n=1 Tax=Portunus trituberculatus TaxID=210409 RepID=A0A5B7E1U2_PORTR|nr:hypothetical protein [Portunus trituberculatus]